MNGVEYFFDAKAEPKWALIDLRKNRKLWEEFQELLTTDSGPLKPEEVATTFKGVDYLFDKNSKPKAVLINLRKYGELWEDLYDLRIIRKRRKEPTVSLQEVDEHLRKLRKIK